MKKQHKTLIYNVEVAQKYGLHAAVLLHHIDYWVEFNKMNNKTMLKDGAYWMYQTQKKMALAHPGFSIENVKGAIKKLKTAKLIVSKQFFVTKNTQPGHYHLTDAGKKYSAKFRRDGGRLYVDIAKMEEYSTGENPPEQEGKSTSAQAEIHQSTGGNSTSIYKVVRNKGKNKAHARSFGSSEGASGALIDLLDPDPILETIEYDVNTLLSAMQSLSPKANHGDYAHRAVAKRLIKKFTLGTCLNMVEMAMKARPFPYAPSINSVFDLETKWLQLQDFVTRETLRVQKKKNRIISI